VAVVPDVGLCLNSIMHRSKIDLNIFDSSVPLWDVDAKIFQQYILHNILLMAPTSFFSANNENA
jgi:hypothetical protein